MPIASSRVQNRVSFPSRCQLSKKWRSISKLPRHFASRCLLFFHQRADGVIEYLYCLLHLLTAASGTNATKELRQNNSAYRGKADSIETLLFSLKMIPEQTCAEAISCSAHQRGSTPRSRSSNSTCSASLSHCHCAFSNAALASALVAASA